MLDRMPHQSTDIAPRHTAHRAMPHHARAQTQTHIETSMPRVVTIVVVAFYVLSTCPLLPVEPGDGNWGGGCSPQARCRVRRHASPERPRRNRPNHVHPPRRFLASRGRVAAGGTLSDRRCLASFIDHRVRGAAHGYTPGPQQQRRHEGVACCDGCGGRVGAWMG